MSKNRLILNADIERGKISKHIYGHFSEHLGRCIYEGIWVGEDSLFRISTASARTCWKP